MRPFAALIFGWIGDNIGRKSTVILTTFLMSISCLVIAVLPTYGSIGITSSIIMIICRMMQGMSSMGEIVGVRIYLTEMIKPPVQYVVVSLVSNCALIGGLAALVTGWVCISMFLNWRIAFLFGSIIAIIGGTARTRLRETLEFANAKNRVEKALEQLGHSSKDVLKHSPAYQEKVSPKTSLAYLSILSIWPANFFFIYIYCGNIYKSLGYTTVQIIQNNTIVTVLNLMILLFLTLLSYTVHPFKILKARIIIFLVSIPLSVYLLSKISNGKELLLLQLFLVITSCCEDPATSILYKYFPIFKRFTYSSFLHAIAKLFIYATTTFGMIFLNEYFSQWSLLIIMLPIGVCFFYSIRYLEILTLKDNRHSTPNHH